MPFCGSPTADDPLIASIEEGDGAAQLLVILPYSPFEVALDERTVRAYGHFSLGEP